MDTTIDHIKETETFKRHLLDGEYIFTSKATKLKYVYDESPDDLPMERLRKTMSLADCLYNALTHYENATDANDKSYNAGLCYRYIKTAWVTGSVHESDGIVKKLVDCRSENVRLQKEIADISAKYLVAQDKIKMFETKFPPLRK